MNIPYNGYQWNNPYAAFAQPAQANPGVIASADKRIIWVNGIEGAKGYMLEPNQQVMMLDSEHQDWAYIKTADALGRYNLIYLKIKEVSEEELKNDTKPNIDFSNYITREEFNAFVQGLVGGKNEQSNATQKQQLTTVSTINAAKSAT